MPPPPPRPPQPYDKSDYQILREGGYYDMHHFMHSHGLRTYEQDSYDEAKQILDVFREVDQQAWEEQYGYQSEVEEQEYYCDEDWDGQYDEQVAWDCYHAEKEAWEYELYEQEGEAWEGDYGGEDWDEYGDWGDECYDYGEQDDYGYY